MDSVRFRVPAPRPHTRRGSPPRTRRSRRGWSICAPKRYESLDRAVTLFERAVALDSRYARAHLELGVAYETKADYLAIPELRRVPWPACGARWSCSPTRCAPGASSAPSWLARARKKKVSTQSSTLWPLIQPTQGRWPRWRVRSSSAGELREPQRRGSSARWPRTRVPAGMRCSSHTVPPSCATSPGRGRRAPGDRSSTGVAVGPRRRPHRRRVDASRSPQGIAGSSYRSGRTFSARARVPGDHRPRAAGSHHRRNQRAPRRVVPCARRARKAERRSMSPSRRSIAGSVWAPGILSRGTTPPPPARSGAMPTRPSRFSSARAGRTARLHAGARPHRARVRPIRHDPRFQRLLGTATTAL